MCEISSKLTVKTLENVIDVVLMFLLLTSNILFHIFFKVSIVDLEKPVFVCWESSLLNG